MLSHKEDSTFYERLKDDSNLQKLYVEFWLKATKLKPISFATDKLGNVILGKISFRQYFKTVHLPKFLSFLRWLLIDMVRGKEEKIFGIYMFCGLFGEGKTLSMVKHVELLKETHPDIHVYSNFAYAYQDGALTKWEDILDVPHRSVIMIDEIQGTFDSAAWSSFPKPLLLNICQCRKKQVMLLCSAQYYGDVTTQIRRLAMYIVQCVNFGTLDRMFKNLYFHRPKYERWYLSQGTDKEEKIQPYMHRTFVVDDYFYNLYDTNQIVESLKKNI